MAQSNMDRSEFVDREDFEGKNCSWMGARLAKERDSLYGDTSNDIYQCLKAETRKTNFEEMALSEKPKIDDIALSEVA